MGVAYYALGDYRQAVDFLSRAVASLEGDLINERLGLAAPASVLSHAQLAPCLAELGGFVEGIASAEEAVRLAERTDRALDLVYAYRGLGSLHVRKGDLQKAIPVLERGFEICQVWQIRNLFTWFAPALGYAYALSGRVAEALPMLEQGVEQSTSMGMMQYHSLSIGRLGEAYLLAGRTVEAMQLGQRALELSRVRKERGYEAYALRLFGEIAAHPDSRDADTAEGHYRRAMGLATELGMRPLQAHCHLGLGTLYRKVGRMEPARAELATAIEMFRSMAMTFWLPRAEAELARIA